MKSNESAENYLETILVLSKKKPVVRSVDIADELGFKKSSVSVAMKNLREKNHITVIPRSAFCFNCRTIWIGLSFLLSSASCA